MGRGSQSTLKKSDRGSRMTWHEDDDLSSERSDTVNVVVLALRAENGLGKRYLNCNYIFLCLC